MLKGVLLTHTKKMYKNCAGNVTRPPDVQNRRRNSPLIQNKTQAVLATQKMTNANDLLIIRMPLNLFLNLDTSRDASLKNT